MDTAVQAVPMPGAVMLGNDDGKSGGNAHKKADKEIDQGAGGTAYGCQGFLSQEFTDDDRIGGII